jgi:hypothetical protein
MKYLLFDLIMLQHPFLKSAHKNLDFTVCIEGQKNTQGGCVLTPRSKCFRGE